MVDEFRIPIQVLVYPSRTKGSKIQYLLLKRVKSREGFWQGVTGAPFPNEDLSDVAARELREETGYKAKLLKQIDYSYSFPVDVKYQTLYSPGTETITEYVFTALVDAEHEPQIDPKEHEKWMWCSYEEALTYLEWPENKEALKRCHASF